MNIKKLSDEIINQIAAGEVIENQSGIIKELIENSIDAGSTEIEIELKNYGLDEIIVKDNGFGISKRDLLIAPLRHATSKIKSFNDLYNINTMGFRGEALASIFSIAKTKIISKTKNDKAYEINSKKIKEIKETSGKNGTLIIIREIFYNTPARKKYLKSNNLELKSIIEIINRFQVFYENIKFTLKNNNKNLINKPMFDSKEKNLIYVLGKELKNNLLEINEKIKGIKIKGFIGKPSNLSYSFKKNQYIYVNKRFIKSKLINDAIYDGFGENLMKNRHPFFVLFIEIDPQIIDVNIHPTKIKIKFENELEIYEFVRKIIKKIFETQSSFKEFNSNEFQKQLLNKNNNFNKKNQKNQDFNKNEYNNLNIETKNDNNIINKIENLNSKYYSKEIQKNLEIKEDEIAYSKDIQNNQNNQNSKNNQNETEDNIKNELNGENNQHKFNEIKGPMFDTLKEYKILGQLNKTYIIIQTLNEMILIDQHIAEEKYYYEKFKDEFENQKFIKTQMLLKPQIIYLNNSEFLTYKENKEILDKIGFETEEFGSNEIIVRKVPISIRNEILNANNLVNILSNILVNKKIKCIEEQNYSKLASMACRISVMAGDELTMTQMKRMIENLRHLKQPFNCPHGRPTFLRFTYYELNKKFKRII